MPRLVADAPQPLPAPLNLPCCVGGACILTAMPCTSGLNLNASGDIYDTFNSPWDRGLQRKNEEYRSAGVGY